MSELQQTDPRHVTHGGGGQAPKGGIYVTHKIGDVAFYKGGQFLPESISVKSLSKKNPGSNAKAKTKSCFSKKKRESLETEILKYKEVAEQRVKEGYTVAASYKWTQSSLWGWCYFVDCSIFEGDVWRGAFFQRPFFIEGQAIEVTDMLKSCYGL